MGNGNLLPSQGSEGLLYPLLQAELSPQRNGTGRRGEGSWSIEADLSEHLMASQRPLKGSKSKELVALVTKTPGTRKVRVAL